MDRAGYSFTGAMQSRPFDHAWIRSVLPGAMVAIGSFVLVALTFAWTRHYDTISVVWPFNALVIVSVLKYSQLSKPYALVGYALGIGAASLAVGYDWQWGAVLVAFNVLECYIIIMLINRTGGIGPLNARLVMRCLSIGLISCAVSTASAWCLISLALQGVHAFDVFLVFLSHAGGLVLFWVAYWVLTEPCEFSHKAPAWRIVTEFGLLSVVAVYGMMSHNDILLYFVTPILVLIAFDAGMRGAVVSMFILTLASITSSLVGNPNEFGTANAERLNLLQLQAFLLINAVMAFIVAATIADRNRALRVSEQAQARLNTRADELEYMLACAHMAESLGNIGHWSLSMKTGEYYWSPEVYAIHGTNPDTYDPNEDPPSRFYANAYPALVLQKVHESLKTGEPVEIETSLTRAGDGATRTIRARFLTVADSAGEPARVFGVIRDETDERAAHHELVRQEQKYRLIAESTTDLIIQYRPDGRIEYASPAVEEFGVTQDQIIGLRMFDFIHPDDLGKGLEFGRRVLFDAPHDPPPAERFRVRQSGGRYVWLEGVPSVLRGYEWPGRIHCRDFPECHCFARA